MDNAGDIFLSRAGDTKPALFFENQWWSGNGLFAESACRANYLKAYSGNDPVNVGLLMDNIPEHVFWIGACALAGATIAFLNSTRKGEDLARDVSHSECGFLVVESRYFDRLPPRLVQQLGDRLLVVDTPQTSEWSKQTTEFAIADASTTANKAFCLIFTSGTSGAPKAAIYSHRRVLFNTRACVENMQLTSTTVSYVAMPLFHSTGLLMGMLPSILSGGAVALRRRFSASGFLDDVRKYGVTFFPYVGKPLAYILATPEQADDADNTLQLACGSEASDVDIANFSRRFGCNVIDNYGSSEGCITILRTSDTPPGSLGLATSADIAVLNPGTGKGCPRAIFDESGHLCNGNDAIGELVNLKGGALFEGYWRDAQAEADRIRDGVYWSGDLAYRDESGYFYFAGRSSDWLRVDGENIATTPVEQMLCRYPAIACAAAYGVPDPLVGDRLMVAVQVKDGGKLDVEDLEHFLVTHADFCSKWMPSFLRVSQELPMTHTHKILKRTLKFEAWHSIDPVFWKPTRKETYRLMTPQDIAGLEQIFVERKRDHLLPSRNRSHHPP